MWVFTNSVAESKDTINYHSSDKRQEQPGRVHTETACCPGDGANLVHMEVNAEKIRETKKTFEKLV